MSDAFIQQREEFREYTMRCVGVSRELFDQFNRLLAPHVSQAHFRKGDFLQRAGVHVVDGALFQGGAAGSVDEGHQRGIGQQAAKLVQRR